MRKIALLLIVTALLSIAGIVSAQGNESYTVQRGDTITGIANAFDVEVDAILIANNLIDPNSIVAGQVLTIPTIGLDMPRTHVIGAGETLNDIAIRYNTTVEALIAGNTIAQPDNLTVGQVLTLPPVGGPATYPRSYRVDIGDTLRNIGERYGVTWEQLAAYNNITTPNYIQAGIVITIPPADYVVPIPTPAPATGGPVTATAPATVIVIAPAPITYIVQRGDVIELIAQRFGVTIESVRTYNDLSPADAIFPGDVLLIPPTGGPVTTSVVIPRTAVNGTYTVQYGDTMFAIASSFNVNVYTLAQANGILNLNSLYAGQALVIPSN